ncbi:MAG: hypothetical protein ACD_18C00083G0003 [uncultured bacterium]|nr:MAG: hypothetical protein ACD_18C00083G0003 [uncultured bacterium]OGH83345.1 MAG: hypothetical protein A2488_01165 [Candidatus Magasanikbacteria bacterium RIFOXYC12_FULL_32_21b]OGH89560.1 MAG: hypothetical protein A2507_04330 [Candidatus Magasanikbacteria bacterium RIFOXYD12_FULL_33_17]HAO52865.1 hypothetical protein [Candidatus Magasanikbacteria bacterium]
MFLNNLFPNLPTSTIELMIYIVAALGSVLITYAVFLEVERRQDLVFFVGASCLFVYALYIDNMVFMIASAGLGLASLVEFIEIYLGLHKHDRNELKRVKNLGKNKQQ